MNTDKEFLNWIYERMICVHGELDMTDYMINFKFVIDDVTSHKEKLKKELLRVESMLQENERLKAELAEVKRFLQELYHSGNKVVPELWRVRMQKFVR